eukprot:scaffold604209_cov18-Prasinocladus_malaysianus.AAC.1
MFDYVCATQQKVLLMLLVGSASLLNIFMLKNTPIQQEADLIGIYDVPHNSLPDGFSQYSTIHRLWAVRLSGDPHALPRVFIHKRGQAPNRCKYRILS